MSAARHLHPDQLAMFMPAHVLADPTQVEHADQAAYEDIEQMRTIKQWQSAEGSEGNSLWKARHGKPSLQQSIAAEGVKTPVSMSPYGPTVMDGHHRVFSAESVNKHMEIPVEWID